MKPKLPQSKQCKIALFISAVVSVIASDVMARNGHFADGVDLGNNGETSLWWSNDTSRTTLSDIFTSQGSFVWRDSVIDTPASAKEKMRLSENNLLTLYKSDGLNIGLSLDPDVGRITLPAGTGTGIFFGTAATATLKADANGAAIFPNSVILEGSSGTLNIQSDTPATSSASGALTVTGGIGVGDDSYFNGVRIGRGNQGVLTNTALGSEALNSNTTGHANSATGYQALRSNTTGYHNSATGYQALRYNATGFANVAIGASSGCFQSNGTTALTDPENSIYIGANSRGKDNNDSNSIVIGYQAIGEGANTTVIGNTTTTMTRLFGETNLSSLKVSGNSVLTGTLRVGDSPVVTQSTLAGYGYQTASQVDSIVTAKTYQTEVQVDSAITSKGYLTSGSATTEGFMKQADVDSRVATFGYQTAAQVEATLNTKDYVITSNIGSVLSAQAQVQLPTTTIQGDTVLNGKVIISVPQGDISMGSYQ